MRAGALRCGTMLGDLKKVFAFHFKCLEIRIDDRAPINGLKQIGRRFSLPDQAGFIYGPVLRQAGSSETSRPVQGTRPPTIGHHETQ